MIELTNSEIWAFNVLSSSVQNAQQELQRAIAARDAYIKLLENKYEAEFDMSTGQLKPKGKESKDALTSKD